jgi:hypothetical protein
MQQESPTPGITFSRDAQLLIVQENIELLKVFERLLITKEDDITRPFLTKMAQANMQLALVSRQHITEGKPNESFEG